MEYLILIIPAAIAVLLIWLLLKLLKKPIKWAFKLLLNALSGYLFLIIFNFFGGIVGLHLPITWLTAVVTGVFGVPGVVVLLLLGL